MINYNDLYDKINKIIFRIISNKRLFINDNSITYDDLEQQGHLIVLENIQDYDPDISTIDSWLFVLLSGHLINYIKDHSGVIRVGRSRVDRGIGSVQYTSLDEVEEQTYELEDETNLHDILIKEINRLVRYPDNEMLLYYYGLYHSKHNITLSVLSDMYGYNPKTVFYRLRRGILALERSEVLKDVARPT